MSRQNVSTTILLADDHPVVLRGLASLINGNPGFEIVASCSDGSAALAEIQRSRPDIAVIDLNMPGVSGLDILREVRAATLPARIVFLTADIGDADIMSAVSKGLDGLIMKDAAPDTLVDCLRAVAAGCRWLPAATIVAAMDRETQRRDHARDLFKPLTEREREVLGLASRDLSNKEIARDLNISEGTVKVHLNKVYSKLNVSSRVSLQAAAGEYLDLLS